MGRRRLFTSVMSGLVLISGACSLFVWYEVTHLRIDINDEQFADAEIALKGSLGKAIFDPQQTGASSAVNVTDRQDLDKVLTESGTHSNEGLIEAYKKSPQDYRRYAQMFDTAINANHVGEAVVQLKVAHLPRDSSSVAMDSRFKMDAWGNPFCIIPLSGRVAVVSGGPSKFGCDALPVRAAQIEKSERNIFAGPSDLVIVIAPDEKAARTSR